ncbi:MAG: ATP-binding cassette domain-containing protein [Candidatus Alkanophagales archaeon]
MLEIEGLTVEVGGRTVLRDLNLHVGAGEVHVLFGPNGSGKTTLLMTILGFPEYVVRSGRIVFKGEDITGLPTHERVRRGIGVLFQRPPAIRGVRLSDVLNICRGRGGISEEEASRLVELLKLSEFMDRDVNLGFSGGEVKRSELLQVIVQNPELALLDEPDSGVDVENVELIGKVLNEFLERGKRPSERRRAALIITHSGFILNYVHADRAHVMLDGTIACSGTPDEIFKQIMSVGYEECIRRCRR